MVRQGRQGEKTERSKPLDERSPEFRLLVVKAVKGGSTSSQVAKAFGLTRQCVHRWRQLYDSGGDEALKPMRPGRQPAKVRTDEPRRRAVAALKEENPEYGARKISAALERFQAIGVSPTEVRRILHEEGLLPEREAGAERERPERRFERAEPNQLWQSDIFTFLLRRHERVYLTAFMDDHSRFVVGWALSRQQKSALVMEAFQKAVAKYGVPREALTDQGRQYTAWRGTTEFEEELRRNGIRHIKSRPHHPQTLGKVERFWKTLWEEFLSRTVFADYEDCQRRLGLFIDGYNFQRPHQGIGNLLPADRYFRAAEHVRAAVSAQVKANALQLAKQQPAIKPFYLVGRLGDVDLSIAADHDGLRIQLGDGEPQMIRLQKGVEDGDDESGNAAEKEMADALTAAGPDRAAACADGAERAVGGEDGERGGGGGGDLARTLLPFGEQSPEGDAGGAGAGSGRGTASGRGGADRGVGEAAAADVDGEAASGPDAGADAQADAARPLPGGSWPAATTLDAGWERRLAGEEGGPQAEGEWRERAAVWERKLAGERAVSEGRAEVRDDGEGSVPAEAGSASGIEETARGGDGGAERRADGDGGGAAAERLPEPLPDAAPQSAGGADSRIGTGNAGAAAAAGGSGPAAAADAAAGEGERTAAAADGDERQADGGGGRDPAGPGTTATERAEEEVGIVRGSE